MCVLPLLPGVPIFLIGAFLRFAELVHGVWRKRLFKDGIGLFAEPIGFVKQCATVIYCVADIGGCHGWIIDDHIVNLAKQE